MGAKLAKASQQEGVASSTGALVDVQGTVGLTKSAESSASPSSSGTSTASSTSNSNARNVTTSTEEVICLQEEYTHDAAGAKVEVTDFELLKVLGKGAYGKVMLCRRKQDTKEVLYAMKTMRKATLLKRDQIAHAHTERYILQNLHCPFLTRLVYAFQTPDKLYMCLEYLAGGELFFWLKKERRFSE